MAALVAAAGGGGKAPERAPARSGPMRAIALCLLTIATPAVAREQPLRDLLVLDRDAPVVSVEIGGRRLRLAVDLAGRDTADLAPGVIDAIPGLRLHAAPDALVGTVRVAGRQASTVMRIDGMAVPLVVTAYDRAPAAGPDGTIAAALLPYRTIRLTRAGSARPAGPAIPLVQDETTGAHVPLPTPNGPVFIQFAPDRPTTVATGAAGARLAAIAGGHLEGPLRGVAGAFGIPRSTRMLVLDRPVVLAGRPVSRLAVRIEDFRGALGFPAMAAEEGALVVEAKPRGRPLAWPSVTLGQDRLGGCDTIVVTRAPATIALGCTPQ